MKIIPPWISPIISLGFRSEPIWPVPLYESASCLKKLGEYLMRYNSILSFRGMAILHFMETDIYET